MTDGRKILEESAQVAAPPVPALSFAEWAALPLAMRVSDRLVDILIAASEIQGELQSQEATPLAWISPELDDVLQQVDEVLRRLAS